MTEQMEGKKDYVKNLKEMTLPNDVNETLKSIDIDVDKFDKDIEESFQTFLKGIKKDLKSDTTREYLQSKFNEWLDSIFEVFDQVFNNKIGECIIKPTEFELINFKTAQELLDLQAQVDIQQRDATVQSEIVSVNGSDLHINTYKDNSGERVDKNKIAELFNKNFEKKDELLNLLKAGKIEDVKKFQRIIANLAEDGSEDAQGKDTLLGKYGVDGKFGGNTMQAFQDYVAAHEISTPQPIQRDGTETNNGGQDVVQATVNVTGNVIPTAPTGSPAGNPETVTPTSDIDNFEFEINKKEEIDVELAREIVQKEKDAGKRSIQLENLKKITPEIASILAGFEGELHFDSLEELTPEIIKAFISEDSKCTLVKFPGGYIENKNGKFSISITDGETFTDITDENIPENIYSLLTKKEQNSTQQPVQPTTTPSGSNNQNQSGANGGVTPTAEGSENNVETHELNLSYIELENKLNEELQAIASNLPKIRVLMDGNNKYNLYIPKNLGDFRAFNVAYTPEMAQYATEQVNGDGVKCLIIPANIKIGLIKNIGINTLVLGDHEIKNGLVNLNSDSQLIGDPQKYNGDLNQASLKITEHKLPINTPNGGEQVQGEQEQGQGEGEEEQNTPQESRNEYHNLENDQYGEMSPEALATNYEAIIAYMEGENNNNLIQAFQKLEINPNSIANALSQVLKENKDVTTGNFTREHISREAMNQLGRNRKWFVNEKNQLVNILNSVNKDKLMDFINEMKVFNDIRELQKTKKFIEMNKNNIKTKPFAVLADFNKSGDLGRGAEGLRHDGRTSEQAMFDIFLSLADTEVKGLNKEIIDGENTADLVQGFVSMIKSLGEGRYEDIEDKFAGKYTIENLGNYIIEHPETLVLYQQTLNILSYNPSVDIKDIVSYKRRQSIIDNEMQDIKEISTNRDAVQAWFEKQVTKDKNLGEWFEKLSAKEKENAIGNLAIWLNKGGILQTIVKAAGVGSKVGVKLEDKDLDKWTLKWNFLKDDSGIGPRISFCRSLDTTIIENESGEETDRGYEKGLGIHIDVPIANLMIARDINRSNVETSTIHGNNPITEIYGRLGINVGGGFTIGEKPAEEVDNGLGDEDSNTIIERNTGFHLSAGIEAALGTKIDYKKGIEVKSNNFGNMLQNQIFKEPDFSSKEGFSKKATESIDKLLESEENTDKNLKKFMKNNREEMYNCVSNVSEILDALGVFLPDKKQEHKEILLDSIIKGIVEEVKNQNLSELNGKTRLTKIGIFGQAGVSAGIDFKKLFKGDFKGAFKSLGLRYGYGLEATTSAWNMLYLPDKEKYEYMDAQLKSGESIKPLGEGVKTNNIENMKNTIAQALSENSIPNIKVEGNEKSQIEISVTDEVLQKYGKNNIYELFNIYVNPDKKNNVAISEDGKTLTMGGNNLENFSVATRRYFNDFAVYLMIGGKGIDGCGNNKINNDTVSEYNEVGHTEQVPGFEFTEHPDEYKEDQHPLDNLFESYNVLNTIFKDIEKKLSLMDNGNNGAYAAFMNAAATEDIEDVLDTSDYEKAFQNLSNLLKGKLKDPCFDGLRGKLNNATFEEKVMIVDRFKAIFSYNDNLINKHNLELQLKGRGNKYKELYGYDRSESFPLESNFDYRKAVQERLNEKGKFERVPNANLVGMTAFYRLGDKNTGRSYMMTELGGTNVLGGEMIPITDANDLKLTKKWFEKNLDKSGVHKDLLKASLSTKLKSILNIEELSLSDENLKSLLAGEDIDIGDKKVKINTKYVFYLLGECGNESIGIELGNITIKTKVEHHDDDEIKDNVLEIGVDGQTLTKEESLNQNDVSVKADIHQIKNIIKKVVTTEPTPGGGSAGTEVIDDGDNITGDDDGI